MKKRIAIIGANEFQNPLILKAKELGYETYVFAWKADDIGEKTADHFIPISIIDKEAIWDYCDKNGIIACASIASDLATHTVNFIQRKLNKPCNPLITDTIATNKYEMRKALSASGVICPKFLKFNSCPSDRELIDFKYPLIIKPVDRSGSRGINKINSYNDLCKHFDETATQSFSKEVIIEEYIEGNEYSCEAISFDGQHHVLQFTKKFTTGYPNFIETGHQEPSDIPPEHLEKIKEQIINALNALHIEYGASHTEFKLDDNFNVHIIEIGARMGGDFIGSDLVKLSTGFDFVQMVLDVSLGKKPSLVPTIEHHNKSFVKFIFSESDLDGYNLVKNDSKFSIIKSSIPSSVSGEVTDSSNRHGYYIYVSDEKC